MSILSYYIRSQNQNRNALHATTCVCDVYCVSVFYTAVAATIHNELNECGKMEFVTAVPVRVRVLGMLRSIVFNFSLLAAPN